MKSDERKREVIAHEWTSLRVLWDRCKGRVEESQRKEIEDLSPKGDGLFPKDDGASPKDDGASPKAASVFLSGPDAWNRFHYAEQRVGMVLDGYQLKAEYLSFLELARSRKLSSLRLHECNKKKLFEETAEDPKPEQREAYRALLYDLQSSFADSSYHRRLRRETALRLAAFGPAALAVAFGPLLWLWLCSPSGTEKWEHQLLEHQPAALLILVAGFGVLGAYFSRMAAFQARLATLEFDEVMNLYRWPMLVVRLMIGLIAALLLYWFLRAGLIGGTAFPRIGPMSQQGPPAAAGAVEPTTELAKLLAWSFVAGFSERLIPDALGRTEGTR
jgi:hypothetical protein